MSAPEIVFKNGNQEIVWIPAGHKLFVLNLLGSTLESVTTRLPDSGKSKVLKFTQDALVSGESMLPNGKTMYHARFGRPGSQFQEIIPSNVTFNAKLREALKRQQIATIHIPGGLPRAVLYPGELLVANYSLDGGSSTGWIINEQDAQTYVEALPPLAPSGVTKTVWVDMVGWLDVQNKSQVEFVDHDPSDDATIPEFFDRQKGEFSSENRQIIRIEFDSGSFLITKIFNQTLGEYQMTVIYNVRGGFAMVGKGLPYDLRLKS